MKKEVIEFQRGHNAYEDSEGQVRFWDDDSPVDDQERPCIRCGKIPGESGGDDPCLGHLPGVKAACCGHGAWRGYIMFTDGTVVTFNSKSTKIDKI